MCIVHRIFAKQVVQRRQCLQRCLAFLRLLLSLAAHFIVVFVDEAGVEIGVHEVRVAGQLVQEVPISGEPVNMAVAKRLLQTL